MSIVKDFPLYDELLISSKCVNNIIPNKELKEEIFNISELDKKNQSKHHNNILALIYHHSLLNEQKRDKKIPPYKIKLCADGEISRCDLDNLPLELIKILQQYIIKYQD